MVNPRVLSFQFKINNTPYIATFSWAKMFYRWEYRIEKEGGEDNPFTEYRTTLNEAIHDAINRIENWIV